MSKIVRASTLYVVCLSHGFPADLPGALKPLSCPFSTRLSFFFILDINRCGKKFKSHPFYKLFLSALWHPRARDLWVDCVTILIKDGLFCLTRLVGTCVRWLSHLVRVICLPCFHFSLLSRFYNILIEDLLFGCYRSFNYLNNMWWLQSIQPQKCCCYV